MLTGRGADIILIDDPPKPEEALSDAQRQAANDWYDHTLHSRQNDKRRSAIVIIMQRLQEDDLRRPRPRPGAGGNSELPGNRRKGTRSTGSRRSWDRDASCAVRARRCTPTASRLKCSTVSGGRSANTTSRASISNRRPHWAAGQGGMVQTLSRERPADAPLH